MKSGRFLTAAMIVFALVVVPTAAYVGGYYWLPETIRDGNNYQAVTYRWYGQRWQANMFAPAGKVEAWLTDSVVIILVDGEPVDL